MAGAITPDEHEDPGVAFVCHGCRIGRLRADAKECVFVELPTRQKGDQHTRAGEYPALRRRIRAAAARTGTAVLGTPVRRTECPL